MATTYTQGRTFVTGEVETASIFNTYLTGNLQWVANDKPVMRCYSAASQNVASVTQTALTFDTNRFDNNGMHSTSSNKSRATVQTGAAGKYLFGGLYTILEGSDADGVSSLRVNGATIIAQDAAFSATWTYFRGSSISFWAMAVADYMEFLAYHAYSITLGVNNAADYCPEFWGVWLST